MKSYKKIYQQNLPEEKHHRNRVIQLIHCIEIGNFRDVNKIAAKQVIISDLEQCFRKILT